MIPVPEEALKTTVPELANHWQCNPLQYIVIQYIPLSTGQAQCRLGLVTNVCRDYLLHRRRRDAEHLWKGLAATNTVYLQRPEIVERERLAGARIP